MTSVNYLIPHTLIVMLVPLMHVMVHLGMVVGSEREVFVRATLPPSMLFADSMLPRKGYTISIPKA